MDAERARRQIAAWTARPNPRSHGAYPEYLAVLVEDRRVTITIRGPAFVSSEKGATEGTIASITLDRDDLRDLATDVIDRLLFA